MRSHTASLGVGDGGGHPVGEVGVFGVNPGIDDGDADAATGEAAVPSEIGADVGGGTVEKSMYPKVEPDVLHRIILDEPVNVAGGHPCGESRQGAEGVSYAEVGTLRQLRRDPTPVADDDRQRCRIRRGDQALA